MRRRPPDSWRAQRQIALIIGGIYILIAFPLLLALDRSAFWAGVAIVMALGVALAYLTARFFRDY